MKAVKWIACFGLVLAALMFIISLIDTKQEEKYIEIAK